MNRFHFSRRHFLATATASGLTAGLAACGQAPVGPSAERAPDETQPKVAAVAQPTPEPITVVWLDARPGWVGLSVSEAQPAIMQQQHPHITVRIDQVPDGEDRVQRLRTPGSRRDGAGPLHAAFTRRHDALRVDGRPHPIHAAKSGRDGRALPGSPPDVPLQVQTDGYAARLESLRPLLQPDPIRRSGRGAAAALEPGMTSSLKAVHSINPTRANRSTPFWCAISLSLGCRCCGAFGGDWVTADSTAPTCTHPRTVEAVRFVRDLMNKQRVAAPHTHEMHSGHPKAAEYFVNGQLAMYMMVPGFARHLANANVAPGSYDIALNPTGSAGRATRAGGNSYAMLDSAQSKTRRGSSPCGCSTRPLCASLSR